MPELKVTLALPVKEERFGKPAEVMRQVREGIQVMHEYTVGYYKSKGIDFKLYEMMSESGDPVETRARLVDRMMGSHIFFLDSDSRPDKDCLVRLLEADKDFVAAPMVQQGYPHLTNVFTKVHGENFEAWRIGRHFHEPDVLMGKIMECDAHGFGGVLLKREVFDDIRPPWFNRIAHFIFPVKNYGHDISFCIRAKEAGIPIFTHFGAKVRHATVSYLWLDNHIEAFQMDPNLQNTHMVDKLIEDEVYLA